LDFTKIWIPGAASCKTPIAFPSRACGSVTSSDPRVRFAAVEIDLAQHLDESLRALAKLLIKFTMTATRYLALVENLAPRQSRRRTNPPY